MKLARIRLASGKETVGLVQDREVLPLDMTGEHYRTLTEIFEAADPASTAEFLVEPRARRLPLDQVHVGAPLDCQEVWAAGVTYRPSRAARMRESRSSADIYQKVYDAPRPELFFKATPSRVVGPGRPIRIRHDAGWNVPEPELALVINSRMELVGFTIGNDVSARDIEGENPLYLPQAKIYDGSCALGPCVTLAASMPPREQVRIRMWIMRREKLIYDGETMLSEMARSYEDLIGYLARDNTFREGVILLTGTGIVPDDKFTLHAGDVVNISIDGIGTLSNPVVQA